MCNKNKLTMKEIKDLLDGAEQTRKFQELLFEINVNLQQIKILLMRVHKISNI